MHSWFYLAMLSVLAALLLAFVYLNRYFSGWQIPALALWLEVSYYMIYYFMARFTALIGLDGFGASSFACAGAYARVAQVCLDEQENDKAFRYLRNATAMTAKVVRLKGFSSRKLADMVAMIDVAKKLRPLQLSSWERKIVLALGKLPDLEEISKLADQFEGDKAQAWIKQLTLMPRSLGLSRYVERTLGALVAIATLIAVFANDSQKAWLLANLQTAYDPSSILGAISVLFAYYLLIFTIRINDYLPSVSPSLLKKVDLIAT